MATRDFPLYMIRSHWSLARLSSFIKEFGEVGSLKVISDTNGTETERTLALLSEGCFENLAKAGYTSRKRDSESLSVTPYICKEGKLLAGNSGSRSLFIPVPQDLKSKELVVAEEIEKKLQQLVAWKILPPKSWDLFVPLESRQWGIIKTGCFINFRMKVSVIEIGVVRIIIDNTTWENGELLHCFWGKPANKNNKSENTVAILRRQSPTSKSDNWRGVTSSVSLARIINDEGGPLTVNTSEDGRTARSGQLLRRSTLGDLLSDEGSVGSSDEDNEEVDRQVNTELFPDAR